MTRNIDRELGAARDRREDAISDLLATIERLGRFHSLIPPSVCDLATAVRHAEDAITVLERKRLDVPTVLRRAEEHLEERYEATW